MAYDIIGNIAILKGEDKTRKQKLKEARALLRKPHIRTVLEKSTNVKGRLRTIKTKYILGEKTLIAECRENNSIFRFNVETCYFSPRLANERQLISEKINMNDSVLVMFAGVGVYPIVIYKYRKPIKIVGIELGKECCKYFRENLKLNKIPNGKIEVVQGDVKKKINGKEKYDVVIMARPNLKDSFLKYSLIASKKGTRLFYYGFCRDEDIKKLIDNLLKEAKDLNRKVKLKEYIHACDIAPYKHRFRIEFEVLD
ncbi:hypothetical protein J4218_05530 [Candidatus Pacearchaeota archaeon]|nr:hypothetical protein [Candidatus Pacearchaeota archaeon]